MDSGLTASLPSMTAIQELETTNVQDYTGKLFAVGDVHSLSKRTSLYTTLSQVNNSDTGRFLIPGGSAITPGQDSSGFEAGIYHSF
jgi:predicted porin